MEDTGKGRVSNHCSRLRSDCPFSTPERFWENASIFLDTASRSFGAAQSCCSISVKSYRKLFGKEAEVRAIHAGLECGLFYEKFPGIDMISFGPTIKGAHTPEERINIETTSMFWNLLLDVLENIPER